MRLLIWLLNHQDKVIQDLIVGDQTDLAVVMNHKDVLISYQQEQVVYRQWHAPVLETMESVEDTEELELSL
jgi:hypothetical protein